MADYYYLDDAEQPQGPYSLEELRCFLTAGKLSGDCLVAADGGAEWKSLRALLQEQGMLGEAAAGDYMDVESYCSSSEPDSSAASAENGRSSSEQDGAGQGSPSAKAASPAGGSGELRDEMPPGQFTSTLGRILSAQAQLLFDFSGRASVLDYLVSNLLCILLCVFFAFLIPFYPLLIWVVSVRRLHDLGRTGFWLLLPFAASLLLLFSTAFFFNPPVWDGLAIFFNSIFASLFLLPLLIFLLLCCLPGKTSANVYGPAGSKLLAALKQHE